MDISDAVSTERLRGFSDTLNTARQIARDIAAAHARAVDTEARFPRESITALQTAGLLAAAVPRSHGGPGHSLAEQAQLCAALAQGCGSTAMVFAMHLSQLASVPRHHGHSPCNYTHQPKLLAEQTQLETKTTEL
ncbi:MAG: acyl-CoA dehydrogenase family protein, partial [Rubrivivax sp.]